MVNSSKKSKRAKVGGKIVDDSNSSNSKDFVSGFDLDSCMFNHLLDKYGLSKKDILSFAKLKSKKTEKLDLLNLSQNLDSEKYFEKSIPLTILRIPQLSSLESIVKFLRENRKLSYLDIGKILNRNPKTLAVSYSVASKKYSQIFSEDIISCNECIPFSAFNNSLSILESVCTFLKSSGLSYAEISRIIAKDQRTIWTVCSRAHKKSVASDNVVSSKNSIKSTNLNDR